MSRGWGWKGGGWEARCGFLRFAAEWKGKKAKAKVKARAKARARARAKAKAKADSLRE
jgi:hypothetical protein